MAGMLRCRATVEIAFSTPSTNQYCPTNARGDGRCTHGTGSGPRSVPRAGSAPGNCRSASGDRIRCKHSPACAKHGRPARPPVHRRPTAPATDTAQPSAGTTSTNKEEKKEGERSDAAEKKEPEEDDSTCMRKPPWSPKAIRLPAQYSGPNSLNSAASAIRFRPISSPACGYGSERDALRRADVGGVRPEPDVRHRGISNADAYKAAPRTRTSW